MQYRLLIIAVGFLIMASTISCLKRKRHETVDGTYYGEFHESYRSADPLNGYQERDTTYEDFYIVTTDEDSIYFERGNQGQTYITGFALDAENKYTAPSGTRSRWIYEINPPRNLKVSYTNSGGAGFSFNEVNMSFNGRR